MASAFKRIDGIGGSDVYAVDTTQQHPLGFRIKAQDVTLGYADFVYVKGVANGLAGLVATYIPDTGVTVLTLARAKGPAGVMMAALVAATFGWLQVSGTAEVQVNGAVVAGAVCYVTAGAGKLDDAVVAGDILYGAAFTTNDGTPVANWARAAINYPFCGDTDNA